MTEVSVLNPAADLERMRRIHVQGANLVPRALCARQEALTAVFADARLGELATALDELSLEIVVLCERGLAGIEIGLSIVAELDAIEAAHARAEDAIREIEERLRLITAPPTTARVQ